MVRQTLNSRPGLDSPVTKSHGFGRSMTRNNLRDIATLTETARQVRIDIVHMLNESGSGHPGVSLSATDLLVGLFFGNMNLDPQQPLWPGRDRFVLSKGHGAPAHYKLDNLTAIIDNNGLQIDGFVFEVNNIEPIAAKWLACHGN